MVKPSPEYSLKPYDHNLNQDTCTNNQDKDNPTEDIQINKIQLEDMPDESIQEVENVPTFEVPNSNILLFDYQVEAYEKACSIFQTEPAYLDTSKMGSGKTVLTLAVSATFGMSLIIVCPLGMINTWLKEADKYGISILKILTFDSLRGSKTNPPKHGMLKIDADGSYSATDEFIALCESESVLFVIDEVHKVKDPNTASLHAAHCLVKTIIEVNERSRIALLGETPLDKPEFVGSILKLLGIVGTDKMYRYDYVTRQYILEGMLDVIDKAKEYDKKLTKELREPVYFEKATIDKLSLDLYVQIIKPHVSFGMQRPIADCKFLKICRNGYFDMTPGDVEELRAGVNMLTKATRFRPESGTINLGPRSMPAVMKSMTIIERAKVNTSIRLARQTLLEDPQAKVLLFFSYIEDMKKATQALSEFDPLLMYGETKTPERTEIEEKFQRPTDDYRLLISNPVVGGVGINLDDRDGNWPRTMFIIPSYYFINLQQCTGRIYRPATTKSNAKIFFLYSKDFPHEVSIIDSLLRKAQVLRSIKNINDSDPLPGEYVSWFEGEGDRPQHKIVPVVRKPKLSKSCARPRPLQTFSQIKQRSKEERLARLERDTSLNSSEPEETSPQPKFKSTIQYKFQNKIEMEPKPKTLLNIMSIKLPGKAPEKPVFRPKLPSIPRISSVDSGTIHRPTVKQPLLCQQQPLPPPKSPNSRSTYSHKSMIKSILDRTSAKKLEQSTLPQPPLPKSTLPPPPLPKSTLPQPPLPKSTLSKSTTLPVKFTFNRSNKSVQTTKYMVNSGIRVQ